MTTEYLRTKGTYPQVFRFDSLAAENETENNRSIIEKKRIFISGSSSVYIGDERLRKTVGGKISFISNKARIFIMGDNEEELDREKSQGANWLMSIKPKHGYYYIDRNDFIDRMKLRAIKESPLVKTVESVVSTLALTGAVYCAYRVYSDGSDIGSWFGLGVNMLIVGEVFLGRLYDNYLLRTFDTKYGNI